MGADRFHRQSFLRVAAFFAGIPSCFGQFSSPPPPDSFQNAVDNATSTISAGVIASIVISIIFVLVLGGALFYCLCIVKKRTRDGSQFPFIQFGISQPQQSPAVPPNARSTVSQLGALDHLKTLHFTFSEVLEITNNLRVKLGEGGFGAVYYGKLKDGKQVAVKRLSAASHQGVDEFLNEVEILSRAHHKNLVSLVGYCSEANERILLYEFMSEGTLEDHLHGVKSEQEPLDWLTRLRIAVGAAHGFVYLHNHCDAAIIHRDVKSSNILLDAKFIAKVADFGLSKLVMTSATHVSTGVKGTIGYLDPEYAQTKRLTEKSDVYSFGIILLELISGSQVVTQSEGDFTHIVQWARPNIEKKTIDNIIDKNMTGITSKESIQKVADLALKCAAYQSIHRPPFDDVRQVLEEVLRTEQREWMRNDDDEEGMPSEVSASHDEFVKDHSVVSVLSP